MLLLGPPAERGFVARLRIFNPDGSEAELSGNGAREAMLYLRRRGWTDSDVFSIETIAGEVRARVTGRWTCTLDVGRVSLGPSGEVDVAGVPHAFQHLAVGNPQTPIRVADPEALDLAAAGPPVEHDPRFPNRTNVSFWMSSRPTGSARASGSAGWGRRCPPAPAPAAPPWPTCSAAATLR